MKERPLFLFFISGRLGEGNKDGEIFSQEKNLSVDTRTRKTEAGQRSGVNGEAVSVFLRERELERKRGY